VLVSPSRPLPDLDCHGIPFPLSAVCPQTPCDHNRRLRSPKVLAIVSRMLDDVDVSKQEQRTTIELGEFIRQQRQRANLSLRRLDRKSTRLNSSHVKISYAVF